MYNMTTEMEITDTKSLLFSRSYNFKTSTCYGETYRIIILLPQKITSIITDHYDVTKLDTDGSGKGICDRLMSISPGCTTSMPMENAHMCMPHMMHAVKRQRKHRFCFTLTYLYSCSNLPVYAQSRYKVTLMLLNTCLSIE